MLVVHVTVRTQSHQSQGGGKEFGKLTSPLVGMRVLSENDKTPITNQMSSDLKPRGN